MTTVEFITREIKYAEINLNRGYKKPNISNKELNGLLERFEHWKRIYFKFTGKRWHDDLL